MSSCQTDHVRPVDVYVCGIVHGRLINCQIDHDVDDQFGADQFGSVTARNQACQTDQAKLITRSAARLITDHVPPHPPGGGDQTARRHPVWNGGPGGRSVVTARHVGHSTTVGRMLRNAEVHGVGG